MLFLWPETSNSGARDSSSNLWDAGDYPGAPSPALARLPAVSGRRLPSARWLARLFLERGKRLRAARECLDSGKIRGWPRGWGWRGDPVDSSWSYRRRELCLICLDCLDFEEGFVRLSRG